MKRHAVAAPEGLEDAAGAPAASEEAAWLEEAAGEPAASPASSLTVSPLSSFTIAAFSSASLFS